VITELSLPDTDATKILANLDRDEDAKELFAVVMSERLSPETERKLKYAGIDYLLPKPLDLWKAEQLIGKCVNQARKQLKRME
jgi:hypothetical protein